MANEKSSAGVKCGFYFTSHGGAQKAKWYDLWQAATAVWGICGKNQEQGHGVVGSESKCLFSNMEPTFDTWHSTDEEQSIDVAMYRPPENSLMLNSTISGLLAATS